MTRTSKNPVPTTDPLPRLEAALGAVALMSLEQRGLLPAPPTRDRTATPTPERAAGVLAGAAIGHACGYRWEWTQQPVGAIGPSPETGAEIWLLDAATRATLDHPDQPGATLAEALRGAPRLHRCGNELPEVFERLAAGAPWFEAGVGSFGSGALSRALGVALAHAGDATLRPFALAFDTIVTHATPEAVSVNVALGELVVALLAIDDPREAPGALAEVIASLPPGTGLDALLAAQHVLLTTQPRVRFDAFGPDTTGNDIVAWVDSQMRDRAADSLETDVEPPGVAHAPGALSAAVVHALRWIDSPSEAIRAAVNAGGDSDTIAAITGALVGAVQGIGAFPRRWRDRTTAAASCEALARATASNDPAPSVAPLECDAHIHFLLDRSGSMQSIAGDVVGGFNQFLASQQHQRDQRGDCRMTLVQFDSHDPFEIIADGRDVDEIAPFTDKSFVPRGSTPLLDAVGRLLDHAEARAHLDTSQLVVVFTDGQENASRHWSRTALFDRIRVLQERGWTFVFLGANQDAYTEAGAIGFDGGNTSNFAASADGVAFAYQSLARASSEWRGRDRVDRLAARDAFFGGVKEAESHLADIARRRERTSARRAPKKTS
jgi:ADP-ribosylglycohydrolase